jgi:fucose permease
MPAFMLIPVIYMAFVSLGLPDSVLGVAWPSMRSALGAPLEAAGLIALLGMSCSAVSSVSSGFLNKRFGTGRIVLASSALTALGLLGYSLAPSFAWVLVSALPLGLGGGAVDSSLNGYVASHYSSRHMNWLHASWGIGATIGPIVMTAFIAGSGWRSGYRTISCIQAALALLFLLSLGLWDRSAAGRGAATDEGRGARRKDAAAGAAEGTALAARAAEGVRPRIGGMRRVEPWLQVSMYAVYAACEFSVGIWTASMLRESRLVAPGVAGNWVSLYYGGIMAGRVLTGFVADRLGNRFMARLGMGVAVAGCVLLGLRSADWLALPGLLLLGLGFAPIYPCMMHETPGRFDDATYRRVIGFSIGAACVGGSVLPGLVGVIMSATTLEALAPCVGALILILTVLSEALNRKT